MDRMTLKCYMADTGLLISQAFDENSIVSEELYKKLLFDKLEVNEGMLVENIVAQMQSNLSALDRLVRSKSDAQPQTWYAFS